MKKNTHPTYYYDAKVTCACGNTWTTGSIKKEIRTEVCSKCHPFFTGQQQRLLDMEGQVDRFYRRLQARQDFLEESGYTMETRQKDGLHIVQITTKKKHFLGLGYRVVIFKYDLKSLLMRELVLIDYSDIIDTFVISKPQYNVTINEEKFEN